jgi:hypothetical protein
MVTKKETKQQFKTIGVYPETKDIINFIKRGTGKPKFALTFEYSLFPEPMIIIKAEGQSTFRIEQVPEEVLEKERKARFDELKLDIAEARKKTVREK